jgi:hypothetical protein
MRPLGGNSDRAGGPATCAATALGWFEECAHAQFDVR